MKKSGEREWLSTQELADWLGITVKAVYWLNYTGKGPKRHKIGGRDLRYRRSEVERWLAAQALLGVPGMTYKRQYVQQQVAHAARRREAHYLLPVQNIKAESADAGYSGR